MERKREVIQEIGQYLVVKYYADAVYTEKDKKKQFPYYGDIFSTKEDVLKHHPEAEILEGYGFIDKETDFQPDDTPDWFDRVEEVIGFIKENY